MKTTLKSLLAVAVLAATGAASAIPVSGQGTWETTLQARDLTGDGVADAYYDTALNISWLANGNANGENRTFTWSEANAWAADLVVGDVEGWRLPETIDVGNDGCSYRPGGGGADCGYLPQTNSSELAHMYYVTLGNTGATNDNASTGLANTANFIDLRSNPYWSANEYQNDPDGLTGHAWAFSLWFGYQGPYEQSYNLRAWAVHDGDVGNLGTVTAPVPEPGTYALMFAGLAAVGAVRRKKRES